MSEEWTEEELDDGIVELIDENGETQRYYHLGTMEHKGENYVFFEPCDEEDDDEGTVMVFRLGDEESDELFPIEDDELLDEVFAAFMAKMEEEEEEEAAEEAAALEPDEE